MPVSYEQLEQENADLRKQLAEQRELLLQINQLTFKPNILQRDGAWNVRQWNIRVENTIEVIEGVRELTCPIRPSKRDEALSGEESC